MLDNKSINDLFKFSSQNKNVINTDDKKPKEEQQKIDDAYLAHQSMKAIEEYFLSNKEKSSVPKKILEDINERLKSEDIIIKNSALNMFKNIKIEDKKQGEKLVNLIDENFKTLNNINNSLEVMANILSSQDIKLKGEIKDKIFDVAKNISDIKKLEGNKINEEKIEDFDNKRNEENKMCEEKKEEFYNQKNEEDKKSEENKEELEKKKKEEKEINHEKKEEYENTKKEKNDIEYSVMDCLIEISKKGDGISESQLNENIFDLMQNESKVIQSKCLDIISNTQNLKKDIILSKITVDSISQNMKNDNKKNQLKEIDIIKKEVSKQKISNDSVFNLGSHMKNSDDLDIRKNLLETMKIMDQKKELKGLDKTNYEIENNSYNLINDSSKDNKLKAFENLNELIDKGNIMNEHTITAVQKTFEQKDMKLIIESGNLINKMAQNNTEINKDCLDAISKKTNEMLNNLENNHEDSQNKEKENNKKGKANEGNEKKEDNNKEAKEEEEGEKTDNNEIEKEENTGNDNEKDEDFETMLINLTSIIYFTDNIPNQSKEIFEKCLEKFENNENNAILDIAITGLTFFSKKYYKIDEKSIRTCLNIIQKGNPKESIIKNISELMSNCFSGEIIEKSTFDQLFILLNENSNITVQNNFYNAVEKTLTNRNVGDWFDDDKKNILEKLVLKENKSKNLYKIIEHIPSKTKILQDYSEFEIAFKTLENNIENSSKNIKKLLKENIINFDNDKIDLLFQNLQNTDILNILILYVKEKNFSSDDKKLLYIEYHLEKLLYNCDNEKFKNCICLLEELAKKNIKITDKINNIIKDTLVYSKDTEKINIITNIYKSNLSNELKHLYHLEIDINNNTNINDIYNFIRAISCLSNYSDRHIEKIINFYDLKKEIFNEEIYDITGKLLAKNKINIQLTNEIFKKIEPSKFVKKILPYIIYNKQILNNNIDLIFDNIIKAFPNLEYEEQLDLIINIKKISKNILINEKIITYLLTRLDDCNLNKEDDKMIFIEISRLFLILSKNGQMSIDSFLDFVKKFPSMFNIKINDLNQIYNEIEKILKKYQSKEFKDYSEQFNKIFNKTYSEYLAERNIKPNINFDFNKAMEFLLVQYSYSFLGEDELKKSFYYLLLISKDFDFSYEQDTFNKLRILWLKYLLKSSFITDKKKCEDLLYAFDRCEFNDNQIENFILKIYFKNDSEINYNYLNDILYFIAKEKININDFIDTIQKGNNFIIIMDLKQEIKNIILDKYIPNYKEKEIANIFLDLNWKFNDIINNISILKNLRNIFYNNYDLYHYIIEKIKLFQLDDVYSIAKIFKQNEKFWKKEFNILASEKIRKSSKNLKTEEYLSKIDKSIEKIIEGKKEFENKNTSINRINILEEDKDYLRKQLNKQKEIFNGYIDSEDLDESQRKIKLRNWDETHISKWVKQRCIKLIKKKEKCIDFQPEVFAVFSRLSEIIFKYPTREIQLMSLFLLLKRDPYGGVFCQIGTGEGKSTIVLMLASYKGLQGNKVDILSSSIVLAERDATDEQKIRFYTTLGLSVGSPVKDSKNDDFFAMVAKARKLYDETDIIYSCAGEMEGDILRSEFSGIIEPPMGLLGRGERPFDVLIVDEVDSTAIDNLSAKTLLSGDKFKGYEFLYIFYFFIYDALYNFEKDLREDKNGICYFKGKKIEEKAKDFLINKTYELCDNCFIDSENNQYKFNTKKTFIFPNYMKKYIKDSLKSWVINAYKAKHEMIENVDYILADDPDKEGQKIIKVIDYKNTGVIHERMVWSEGLHQFLQIKHGIEVHPESVSTNFLSNLSYLKKYIKNGISNIFGVTGTIGKEDAQKILIELYNVHLYFIPTFQTKQLRELDGIVCRNENEWKKNIINDLKNELNNGRAVLIICNSILEVEKINSAIEKAKIPDLKIIKYKKNEDEELVKEVLKQNCVIIGTNLVGRGTDIKLEKQTVVYNGGLHVIVTFLPTNKRIEDQNFGRAARQGEPGTARLIIIDPNKKDINDLKKIRDYKEETRIANVMKNDVPEVSTNDEIFKDFCKNLIFKEDILKNPIKRDNIEELFGKWLSRMSKTKVENKDFNKEERMKKFEEFKSEIKNKISDNSILMENVLCNIHCSDLKELYNKEPLFSFGARYNDGIKCSNAKTLKDTKDIVLNNFISQFKSLIMLNNKITGCLRKAKGNSFRPNTKAKFIIEMDERIKILNVFVSYINQNIKEINIYDSKSSDDKKDYKIVKTEISIKEILKECKFKYPNEMEKFLSNFGLEVFYKISLKKKKNWWQIMVVFMYGACLYLGGALLSAASGGILGAVGKKLMSDGIDNMVLAFEAALDIKELDFDKWVEEQIDKIKNIGKFILDCLIQYGLNKLGDFFSKSLGGAEKVEKGAEIAKETLDVGTIVVEGGKEVGKRILKKTVSKIFEKFLEPIQNKIREFFDKNLIEPILNFFDDTIINPLIELISFSDGQKIIIQKILKLFDFLPEKLKEIYDIVKEIIRQINELSDDLTESDTLIKIWNLLKGNIELINKISDVIFSFEQFFNEKAKSFRENNILSLENYLSQKISDSKDNIEQVAIILKENGIIKPDGVINTSLLAIDKVDKFSQSFKLQSSNLNSDEPIETKFEEIDFGIFDKYKKQYKDALISLVDKLDKKNFDNLKQELKDAIKNKLEEIIFDFLSKFFGANLNNILGGYNAENCLSYIDSCYADEEDPLGLLNSDKNEFEISKSLMFEGSKDLLKKVSSIIKYIKDFNFDKQIIEKYIKNYVISLILNNLSTLLSPYEKLLNNFDDDELNNLCENINQNLNDKINEILNDLIFPLISKFEEVNNLFFTVYNVAPGIEKVTELLNDFSSNFTKLDIIGFIIKGKISLKNKVNISLEKDNKNFINKYNLKKKEILNELKNSISKQINLFISNIYNNQIKNCIKETMDTISDEAMNLIKYKKMTNEKVKDIFGNQFVEKNLYKITENSGINYIINFVSVQSKNFIIKNILDNFEDDFKEYVKNILLDPILNCINDVEISSQEAFQELFENLPKNINSLLNSAKQIIVQVNKVVIQIIKNNIFESKELTELIKKNFSILSENYFTSILNNAINEIKPTLLNNCSSNLINQQIHEKIKNKLHFNYY